MAHKERLLFDAQTGQHYWYAADRGIWISMSREEMQQRGFRSVPFASAADVYVINSCTVTAASIAAYMICASVSTWSGAKLRRMLSSFSTVSFRISQAT